MVGVRQGDGNLLKNHWCLGHERKRMAQQWKERSKSLLKDLSCYLLLSCSGTEHIIFDYPLTFCLRSIHQKNIFEGHKMFLVVLSSLQSTFKWGLDLTLHHVNRQEVLQYASLFPLSKNWVGSRWPIQLYMASEWGGMYERWTCWLLRFKIPYSYALEWMLTCYWWYRLLMTISGWGGGGHCSTW